MGVHRFSLPSLSFSSFLSLFLSLFQLFPWRTSLFAISPILSYRRNRTHTRTRTYSLSLLSQVHPIPQTRPRSVDPFRLVLSPALLLAVEIAVTNRALGIQEITKRALPFARSTQGKRIEGRTCKPISSWRSILGCYSETKRTRTDTKISLHLSLYLMIYLPIARMHAAINYLRFARIRL